MAKSAVFCNVVNPHILYREKGLLLVILMLLVVLSLFLLWIGVSLVRRPGENFWSGEKVEPRTLAWWDAYLGGWGFILLAILVAGCCLIVLLALLHILPTDPSATPVRLSPIVLRLTSPAQ